MSDAQVTLAAGLVGVFALVVLAAAISSLITGRLALPGAARLGVSRTSAPVAFRLCLTLMLLTAGAAAWWPVAIMLFFLLPSY